VATYLYGLVLARNAALVPADIAGLQGAPVRVLTCNALGALVSTLDRPPGRATLDDVRAHDGVLQSAVDAGSTAAAVRFGQTFAGDDEACRHVVERAERLVSMLGDFDGYVEIRLLLAHTGEPDAAKPPIEAQAGSGPGRAYLEQLRDSQVHLQGLALRSALGPVVRAERVEELPRSRGVVFSHLVRRDDLTAYREAVAAIPALAEAKMVGPLALYSFAEPTGE
jgi:hypothetical protein